MFLKMLVLSTRVHITTSQRMIVLLLSILYSGCTVSEVVRHCLIIGVAHSVINVRFIVNEVAMGHVSLLVSLLPPGIYFSSIA